MQTDPVVLLIAEPSSVPGPSVAEALRHRYKDGFRVEASDPEAAARAVRRLFDAQEDVAAIVVEHAEPETPALLDQCLEVYPLARALVCVETNEAAAADPGNPAVHLLSAPLIPPEQRLYPLLDELLAEWRASADMPFAQVKGIMTVRAVRIRLSDTLHRAAEVIVLSGVGDLMVIDDDNRFAGVLSVGDVLRAAMPDIEEILGQGGTLDEAFKLFLRKGSELKYKLIAPLVIRDPLVVDPDDHVAKAAALMLQRNIHRLPVVKDGRLVGTVGRTDICQAVVGTL